MDFILRHRMFVSFKYLSFRLYYMALLCQRAAMNMQMVARSLLIYRLTGSGTIMGAMFLANALPMMGLSLFAGVIADRVQRKYVLLAGQAASAFVALSVAVSLTVGYLSSENPGSWWILIFASVGQGFITGFMTPSRQAMISEIVSKEHIMNAVALNTLGMNVLRLMAPAVAGFLIDWLDFEAVYYTMTVMYLLSIIFIVFLPLNQKIKDAKNEFIKRKGVLHEIREGFRYILNEGSILLILFLVLFAVLLSRPYIMLMPIFTDDILKVGASGMGVLLSISGLGAMIGSISLAGMLNKKRGLMLIISCLLLGIVLVSFSFSNSWYLSMALMALIGVGHSARMTLGNSLILYYTEEKYQGRVMSFYELNHGITSLGTFFAGLLADLIGVRWALGSFSIVLIIMAVMALIFSPRIRKLN